MHRLLDTLAMMPGVLAPFLHFDELLRLSVVSIRMQPVVTKEVRRLLRSCTFAGVDGKAPVSLVPFAAPHPTAHTAASFGVTVQQPHHLPRQLVAYLPLSSTNVCRRLTQLPLIGQARFTLRLEQTPPMNAQIDPRDPYKLSRRHTLRVRTASWATFGLRANLLEALIDGVLRAELPWGRATTSSRFDISYGVRGRRRPRSVHPCCTPGVRSSLHSARTYACASSNSRSKRARCRRFSR